MQSNVFAPWAEVVPNAPYPMRAADLAALPDDPWMYEIVEGRLVRMPASGGEASQIGVLLCHYLLTFVLPRKLGAVTGADGTYDLTLPGETMETVVVPDAAFVQEGRFPARGTPAAKGYLKLAPDLVAEVASPSQYHPEMAAKAKLYLERGVRLVWIVWPDPQEVEVWRPGSLDAPVTTLKASDLLDGLDALPGFTLPVSSLFL